VSNNYHNCLSLSIFFVVYFIFFIVLDREATQFELEMSQVLQRAFTDYMGNRISDYCGQKIVEFGKFVYDLSKQVERNAYKYEENRNIRIIG
jgi:hypothetical protein